MKTEISWVYESSEGFLDELKTFVGSLDNWQMKFDLPSEGGMYVYFDDETYQLKNEPGDLAFKCPSCNHQEFECIEGEYAMKPVLGLACINCETYGSIFIGGL